MHVYYIMNQNFSKIVGIISEQNGHKVYIFWGEMLKSIIGKKFIIDSNLAWEW